MRRRPSLLGFIIIGAGVFLILAVILPSEFWWFFIGVALILIGILICRR